MASLQIPSSTVNAINHALLERIAKLEKTCEEVANILAPCGYREVVEILENARVGRSELPKEPS